MLSWNSLSEEHGQDALKLYAVNPLRKKFLNAMKKATEEKANLPSLMRKFRFSPGNYFFTDRLRKTGFAVFFVENDDVHSVRVEKLMIPPKDSTPIAELYEQLTGREIKLLWNGTYRRNRPQNLESIFVPYGIEKILQGALWQDVVKEISSQVQVFREFVNYPFQDDWTAHHIHYAHGIYPSDVKLKTKAQLEIALARLSFHPLQTYEKKTLPNDVLDAELYMISPIFAVEHRKASDPDNARMIHIISVLVHSEPTWTGYYYRDFPLHTKDSVFVPQLINLILDDKNLEQIEFSYSTFAESFKDLDFRLEPIEAFYDSDESGSESE